MDDPIPHSFSHRRGSQSEAGTTPVLGRVPRQQSLTSRNGSNGPSPKPFTSPHPNSTRYVKQCHALLGQQLRAFEEERALWKIERHELHDRISQMEATIHRYQSTPSSQISSPQRKKASSRSSGFWSSMGANGSRDSSASSTGDEVWRGSNPDLKPSRTFPESSAASSKLKERLPSIAENGKKDSTGQGSTDPLPEIIHKSSISGSEIDKDLDGINFKSSGLAPDIIRSVMSSGSASPLQSGSPSRSSQKGTTLSPPSLSAFRELKNDPYTMDAGHTPLASRKYPRLDGSASNPSSNTETPSGPEQGIPPLESHVTQVKPPSERHDSYFPPVEPAESVESDPDPELKGPLGLTNERDGDTQFLSELNTKLLQAAETDVGGPSSPREERSSDQQDEDIAESSGFEQPEHEPKLKIKRSINFGTQLGASSIGKGV